EAVEDDLRLRGAPLDGVDARGRHVDGDALELRGPLGPERFEEPVDGGGAIALRGPHDVRRDVVDDAGDLLVVPSLRQLVDAHVLEPFQAISGPEPGNDALDDLADGAPRDAKQPRRRRPIHHLAK
ncbi:MAG TPA: hypothetical protein VHU90_06305, partial [Galbitalea sp.]|nr:hypothetical protein [Galbitalea sp.]